MAQSLVKEHKGIKMLYGIGSQNEIQAIIQRRQVAGINLMNGKILLIMTFKIPGGFLYHTFIYIAALKMKSGHGLKQQQII